MTVLILDSGVSNLASVVNAVRACGVEPEVGTSAQQVAAASHIILPGVGAYGPAMEKLDARGIPEQMTSARDEGKWILGICLGMQLLATRGLEFGDHAGLDLIPGIVEALPDSDAGGIPVPNVGWHDLHPTRPSTLLPEVQSAPAVYFTHSYRFIPENEGVITSTISVVTTRIVATVESDRVLGAQFHPERSGPEGLALLTRFLSAREG